MRGSVATMGMLVENFGIENTQRIGFDAALRVGRRVYPSLFPVRRGATRRIEDGSFRQPMELMSSVVRVRPPPLKKTINISMTSASIAGASGRPRISAPIW